MPAQARAETSRRAERPPRAHQRSPHLAPGWQRDGQAAIAGSVGRAGRRSVEETKPRRDIHGVRGTSNRVLLYLYKTPPIASLVERRRDGGGAGRRRLARAPTPVSPRAAHLAIEGPVRVLGFRRNRGGFGLLLDEPHEGAPPPRPAARLSRSSPPGAGHGDVRHDAPLFDHPLARNVRPERRNGEPAAVHRASSGLEGTRRAPPHVRALPRRPAPAVARPPRSARSSDDVISSTNTATLPRNAYCMVVSPVEVAC